jgi:hypothetical protein
MSRGYGRVQQVILHAIREPAAMATREDGTGPVGADIKRLYKALYGTEYPERSQRQSVMHAAQRLGPELVQTATVRPRGNGELRAFTRNRTGPAFCEAVCTGDDDCEPCRYGNKAEWSGNPPVGEHFWYDLRPGEVETWPSTSYTSYEPWEYRLSRPSTEAEKAAAEALYQKSVDRARQIIEHEAAAEAQPEPDFLTQEELEALTTADWMEMLAERGLRPVHDPRPGS